MENPKKLEPVSPIKVLAGLKLYGRNPTNAPANAVIKTMDITGAPLREKIINKDKHEIRVIPEDSPSNPSIKLIALVIPIIHATVRITDQIPFNRITVLKIGMLISPMLTPQNTTQTAAIICAASLQSGGIPLESSIKHATAKTRIPPKYPAKRIP